MPDEATVKLSGGLPMTNGRTSVGGAGNYQPRRFRDQAALERGQATPTDEEPPALPETPEDRKG